MKELLIKDKNILIDKIQGRHLSTLKRNGLDFKELREYIYGEDTKKIDWKISAKLQKPYVKEFEEEREINIILAVLASGSLHFGSYRLKSEVVSEIVAILGYSGVKYSDKISLHLISDKIQSLKPTKNIKSIPLLVEEVNNYKYLGKDYDFSFIDYLNKYKKSVLFLVGDFYKHPPIKRLKHNTFVIWIRDKYEETPPLLGEINIINPQTLKEIHTNLNKKNIKKYKDFLEKKDNEFIGYLKKEKIKFTKIYTDEEVYIKLVELLK
jgi:uncharacterized protein (DUF58 family)